MGSSSSARRLSSYRATAPPGRDRAAISGHLPKKELKHTPRHHLRCMPAFPTHLLIVLHLDLLWPSQSRSHFWKLMLSKSYCWGLPNSSPTSNGSISAQEGQSCASQGQPGPLLVRRRQGVSQVFFFLSTTSYFSVFCQCCHILHTQSLGNTNLSIEQCWFKLFPNRVWGKKPVFKDFLRKLSKCLFQSSLISFEKYLPSLKVLPSKGQLPEIRSI